MNILDPKTLKIQKLPHWNPKYRRGVFLKFILTNSNDVPLVLKPTTGNISPQYHMLFDENFSTVQSISDNEDTLVLWNDFALELLTH